MKGKQKYLFCSQRLGFRNWREEDLPSFARMNADLDVMEHFPKPLSKEESKDFLLRLQKHYEQFGYTYFAMEIMETGELIGFVGLAYQEYSATFTPATDIGWRLTKSYWGKGYAFEGAQKCLKYAFSELKLKRVIATCTRTNKKSESLMIKLGMIYKGHFDHPKLAESSKSKECIWYSIENPNP